MSNRCKKPVRGCCKPVLICLLRAENGREMHKKRLFTMFTYIHSQRRKPQQQKLVERFWKLPIISMYLTRTDDCALKNLDSDHRLHIPVAFTSNGRQETDANCRRWELPLRGPQCACAAAGGVMAPSARHSPGQQSAIDGLTTSTKHYNFPQIRQNLSVQPRIVCFPHTWL